MGMAYAMKSDTTMTHRGPSVLFARHTDQPDSTMGGVWMLPLGSPDAPCTSSAGQDLAQPTSPSRAADLGYAVAAARSNPAAWRILLRLQDTGAVSFRELEEALEGWQDWIALAQLLRAGYAAEGHRHLHITLAGRRALEDAAAWLASKPE